MDAKTSQMHVKASSHDGEIRRFQCQTSFEVLDSTVRRLFLIPTGQALTLKYLDDENDYCIVSSQLELDYALSLPTNCLKLTLSTVKAPVPASSETPTEAKPKCGGQWQQHLENRLAWINSKLEQPDLPAHKREKLTARKQWIEAKIANKAENGTGEQCHGRFWKQYQRGPHPPHQFNMGIPPTNPGCQWAGSPHPSGPWAVPHHQPFGPFDGVHQQPFGAWAVPPPHQPFGPFDGVQQHPQACWGARGGMRGCNNQANIEQRLNWIKMKLERPDLPQHKVERLNARKEMLQAKLNALQNQSTPQTPSSPDQACGMPGGPRCGLKIENRLAWVQMKLDQPNLPPHKIEKLTRRKEFLQAKLEQKKTSAVDQQTPTTPAARTTPTPAPVGGHLQAKLDWINIKLQQPNLPPHKFERLTNRKKMIEAKLAQQQGNCGVGRS
jgi:hypothetical protein